MYSFGSTLVHFRYVFLWLHPASFWICIPLVSPWLLLDMYSFGFPLAPSGYLFLWFPPGSFWICIPLVPAWFILDMHSFGSLILSTYPCYPMEMCVPCRLCIHVVPPYPSLRPDAERLPGVPDPCRVPGVQREERLRVPQRHHRLQPAGSSDGRAGGLLPVLPPARHRRAWVFHLYIYIYTIQRFVFVTYSYRMCSEMFVWRKGWSAKCRERGGRMVQWSGIP